LNELLCVAIGKGCRSPRVPYATARRLFAE
jgi:hypothetical protein